MPWLALAVGVCLLIGGGLPLLVGAGAAGTVRELGAVPPARAEPATGAAASVALPASAPLRRPHPLPVPVRIQVPRLHIDAPIVAVAANRDGALAVPEDPRSTGWWDASARPGAPTGSVILDGHVDSATLGLGAFFTLDGTRPGDRVTITDASGQARTYRVVARRRYAKTALPAAEIFSQTVTPRLILITCGGPFNRQTGNYLDNVVIYALPL